MICCDVLLCDEWFFAVHGGEYWRLLVPGDYEITAAAEGHLPLTHSVTITNKPHTEAPRRDFDLSPILDDAFLQQLSGVSAREGRERLGWVLLLRVAPVLVSVT